MRTAIQKSCCSCSLPIETLIGGISWWPVAPTRENQQRRLHHHKAVTTYPQLRAPEVNLFRSATRNPSRQASSWRARPTAPSAVGPLSLNSYLSSCTTIVQHFTQLLSYVTILSIITCNLPFYYVSTCTVRRPTAGLAKKVLREAKQVWQNMLLSYVLLYIIVRIIPTWCFVMGLDHFIQHQYIYKHNVVHSAFYLQHFRHYYNCCNNCLLLLLFSHINSTATMQSVVTGQAPITYLYVPPPLFNVHGIWGSSWMKHTLEKRRSDMSPVGTFDILERRVLVPQAVGR